MIVFWSNDPDTTRGTYSGQESAIWRVWLKEKGVKCVFIDPFYNYTDAIISDDKWIAPRMGTDAALAMAIAYVWITEGTYDKEYVADRTIGFDEFGSATSSARTTASPRRPSGRPRSAASRRGSSARWRASGPAKTHHARRAAPGAVRAAPAARPTAPSGRG